MVSVIVVVPVLVEVVVGPNPETMMVVVLAGTVEDVDGKRPLPEPVGPRRPLPVGCGNAPVLPVPLGWLTPDGADPPVPLAMLIFGHAEADPARAIVRREMAECIAVKIGMRDERKRYYEATEGPLQLKRMSLYIKQGRK